MPVWKPAQREIVRTLLDPEAYLDAAACHYALKFPEERVEMLVHRRPGQPAINGFLARIRTSVDRTQPELISMRARDEAAALALLRVGLPAGRRVYLQIPTALTDLAQQALAAIDTEFHLLLAHPRPLEIPDFPDPSDLEFSNEDANNGTPLFRFLRGTELGAYAGVNWINDRFAEVRTETSPDFRGRGLATILVGRLTRHLASIGRVPLYYVAASNVASRKVAAKLGYTDTGQGEWMGHAVLPAVVPSGLSGLIRY